MYFILDFIQTKPMLTVRRIRMVCDTVQKCILYMPMVVLDHDTSLYHYCGTVLPLLVTNGYTSKRHPWLCWVTFSSVQLENFNAINCPKLATTYGEVAHLSKFNHFHTWQRVIFIVMTNIFLQVQINHLSRDSGKWKGAAWYNLSLSLAVTRAVVCCQSSKGSQEEQTAYGDRKWVSSVLGFSSWSTNEQGQKVIGQPLRCQAGPKSLTHWCKA